MQHSEHRVPCYVHIRHSMNGIGGVGLVVDDQMRALYQLHSVAIYLDGERLGTGDARCATWYVLHGNAEASFSVPDQDVLAGAHITVLRPIECTIMRIADRETQCC